jgi:hypothetical protein
MTQIGFSDQLPNWSFVLKFNEIDFHFKNTLFNSISEYWSPLVINPTVGLNYSSIIQPIQNNMRDRKPQKYFH